MLKTKLFPIVKSMNIIELKRFQSFALSPYHNSNKTITRFLKYIEKYFHTIGKKAELKRFNEEVVFKYIYNGADFNKGTFSVLRSQTLNLLEEFFTIEEFKNKKKLRQKLLAENYSKRKLPHVYQNKFLKYEQINLEEKHTDPHWAMHRLEILMTKMSWHNYDKMEEGYPLAIEVLEDLDVFYLHQKMRNEVLKGNLNGGQGILQNSLSYKKTIGEQLSEYKTKSKVIGLYVRLRELLYGERNINILEEFRREFETAFSDLDYIDQEMIYFELQNLVSREHKQKGSHIASLQFDIYMTGIHHNLITMNDEIHHITFYNIVGVGCSANKFKETEIFISEFGDKINLNCREATLILARARVLFEKGEKDNWQKIIKLSNNFNHSDISFRMLIRSLRVRAFFMIFQEDKTYYDLTLSQIKAFKVFLFREKKNLKKIGEAYQRFVFWLQKLTTAFYKNKSLKSIDDIFSKIENDVKVIASFKEWFLWLRNEKVGE